MNKITLKLNIIIMIIIFCATPYYLNAQDTSPDPQKKIKPAVESGGFKSGVVKLENTVDKDKTTPEVASQKNEQSATKETSPENSGRLFISLSGFGAISLPGGEFSGTGNQKIDAGAGYGAIFNIGYYIFENGGIFLGAEYAGKQAVINRTYMNMPMKNTFTFQFMEVLLGYRGVYKWFYFTAGIYYGFIIGPWTEIASLNGAETVTVISSKYAPFCHDEIGLQIAAGAAIKVTGYLTIDISLMYEVSFVNAYDYIDKIRTNMISLTAGATLRLDLRKKG